MGRPRIKLIPPAQITPGAMAFFMIDVVVDDPTAIRGVVAQLRSRMGCESAEAALTRDQIVRICDARKLPAGEHRFVTNLLIGHDVAPTHHLELAFGWLRLIVRVERAWWRTDVLESFELYVPPALPKQVKRTPIAVPSTTDSDKPRLDLAIASNVMVAGETIHGACALTRVDDTREHRIDLEMEPVFVIKRSGTRVRCRTVGKRTLAVPPKSNDSAIPFAIELSPHITPNVGCMTHDVSWVLIARTGGMKVVVPVDILHPHAATYTQLPPIGAVPRIGTDRVAAIFEEFAAKAGWRVTEEDGEIGIEREEAGTTFDLSYEYREQAALISMLVYPSLGLGVRTKPSKEEFSRPVDADGFDWPKGHGIRARSPAQALPTLVACVPDVMRARKVLGSLASWGDEGIAYGRPIGQLEIEHLESAARALEELDRRLGELRSSITPAPVEVDLDAYRSLGAWLGAQVTVGDLSIDGKLGSTQVIVGLAWDKDRPTAVRVVAGDSESASEVVRAIRVILDNASSPREGVPAAARECVDAWPAGVGDLGIVDGMAIATLPIDGAIDVARIRETVGWACSVLAALDPGGGPYR